MAEKQFLGLFVWVNAFRVVPVNVPPFSMEMGTMGDVSSSKGCDETGSDFDGAKVGSEVGCADFTGNMEELYASDELGSLPPEGVGLLSSSTVSSSPFATGTTVKR